MMSPISSDAALADDAGAVIGSPVACAITGDWPINMVALAQRSLIRVDFFISLSQGTFLYLDTRLGSVRTLERSIGLHRIHLINVKAAAVATVEHAKGER
ncbi:hypothetical protein [Rhizorhabdus argentea]|uniref:hypothetical protein n=1 Tax=Rhizorhabdus argentea TaxID=1387174 RepID=UPI0030EF08A9